jgi:hypothetical protein
MFWVKNELRNSFSVVVNDRLSAFFFLQKGLGWGGRPMRLGCCFLNA